MIETDYPHTDTTWPVLDRRWPTSARRRLPPERSSTRFMRGNAEKLYRFTPASPPST